jgi:hypothetical protein
MRRGRKRHRETKSRGDKKERERARSILRSFLEASPERIKRCVEQY